jgi:hypothetical protein
MEMSLNTFSTAIWMHLIEHVHSNREVNEILKIVRFKGVENKFGVREFLPDHPEIMERVFTEKLLEIIREVFLRYISIW